VDCQSTVCAIVLNAFAVGFAILVICKLLFLKRIMATFANVMTRRRIKMKSYTFFTILVTNCVVSCFYSTTSVDSLL